MKSLQTFLFIAYFVLMMIIVGGTVFATMVEYPNWFAQIPGSLQATRNFYQVLHPGHFFQTFAPLFLLTGLIYLILSWKNAPVRNLMLISYLLMLAAELLTFIYIYPRLGILFSPDAMTQPVDVLQRAANEFTIADRIRTLLGFAAAGFSIAALFRFFRQRYSGDLR